MSLLFIIKCITILSFFNPQERANDSQAGETQLIRKIDELCDLSKKFRDSEPRKGISYGNKAIALARKTDDKKLQAKAYNATGSGYYMLGDFDQALSLYYKGLRLREEVGDSVGISASYNNIANVYNNRGELSKALANYRKSLHIATKVADTLGISGTLTNIGNIYLAQNKFDDALDHYERSLPMKEKVKDLEGVLINLINIGISHSGKGNKELALNYFDKALPLAESLNSQHDKVYALRGKAEAYLMAKQYEPAIQNALESLCIAKEYQGKDEIRMSAAVLNTIYTEIGDYARAHKYLTLYNVYNDSIHNEQTAERMALVQVKYETARRAQENLKLRAEHSLHNKELENKTIIQYFIITLLLLMSLLTIIFFVGRQRLRNINNLLIQKNEQIMQNNLLLQQHQKAQIQQAAELQIQKEELERLNKVKDKLFSVIAHDLRGPLVSLKGLLQVMAMGVVSPEKQKELFNSLVKGQQNVLWMLDNLFDWARAQMHGFEVDRSPIVLSELVDENIRLLYPLANSKGILLTNQIEEHISVLADKEMIRLVLRNLVSNGIKFCHANDTVTLSASTETDTGLVTISVKDTGIGISPEVQQKLFVHNSYSTRGTASEKGSGLGLALCKEFVERNGGSIWVVSETGKGSTFSFTLPMVTEQEAATEDVVAHDAALQLS